jgi:hypothetical protein
MLSAGLNTPLKNIQLECAFLSLLFRFQSCVCASHEGTDPSSGANGDRTHDLRLAKPALSQLSYDPVSQLVRVETGWA